MGRSLELLTEACEPLAVNARKMFGGHGFFAPNGGMFAGIVTDDAIIFKLQFGPLRDDLIRLGGKPWIYDSKMTMKEWIVIPDSFYDDADALAQWAAKAHGAVPAKKLKAPAKKTPSAPTRAPASRKSSARRKKTRK